MGSGGLKMLDKQMEEALNKQIKFELYSSYLYLAMSAELSDLNLPGAASWMRVQATEEITHAMKFYDYILDRNGKVVLEDIKSPKACGGSILEIFSKAYKHEQHVTERISTLVDMALEKRDHMTHSLLQWFVTEQVEEEANTRSVVEQLEMIGTSKDALYMFDRELGVRKASASSENA